MISWQRLLRALLLLCLVSPSWGAGAHGTSDPIAEVMAAVPTPPIAFVAIAPCRLADTRGNGFTGAFGPPSMIAQSPRVFPVAGFCGIPGTAQAVSANVAVTNTSGVGFISIWQEGASQPVPLVASMNYSAGQTIANAVLAPLGSNGGINVYAKQVSASCDSGDVALSGGFSAPQGFVAVQNQRNPNFPGLWVVQMNIVGFGSPVQFVTGSFTVQAVCAHF